MSTKSDLLGDLYTDTVFNQLDFRKEILESDKRMFVIISGVGSGKSYWVKTLTEPGHEDKGYKKDGYNVLLITSRKSTATAQAIMLDAEERFNFSDLFYNHNEMGEIKGMPAAVYCCTNAYIEKFCKHLYKPDDPKTHIWNAFDFIILDEFHSLVFDATFSDSSFYVRSFLRHVHKETDRCRIVMMSGTPDAVRHLYDTPGTKKSVKTIDIYDKCRHIEAEYVRFHPRAGLTEIIVKKLKKGERVIYFANTSDNMKILVEELYKSGIPYSSMGLSYTDDLKKDEKFPPELVAKKKEVEDYLRKNERVMPEVKIFISTSRNREGINILDTDITTMIVESHQRDEIRQMVGRVRNKRIDVAIVADAQQHVYPKDSFDFMLSWSCLNQINEAFEKCTSKDPFDLEEKRRHIETVENKSRYIRYDYLSQKFKLYADRRKGEVYCRRVNEVFQDNWNDSFGEPMTYTTFNPYIPESWHDYYAGQRRFSNWFPYSTCRFYEPYTYEEAASGYLDEIVESGKEITKEERNTIMAELADLAKKHGRKISKQPNKVLNPLGYKIMSPPGQRHTGDVFVIVRLDEEEEKAG